MRARRQILDALLSLASLLTRPTDARAATSPGNARLGNVFPAQALQQGFHVLFVVVAAGAFQHGGEGIVLQPGVATHLQQLFFGHGLAQADESQEAFLPVVVDVGPGAVTVGLVNPGVYRFQIIFCIGR